eukprot:7292591-Pyramimonas_sp.AAC.1
MASPDVEIVEFVDQDVSHHILDMAHGEVGEFDVQSFLSDWCNVVFFKVVNVRPEARQHMYVPRVFHNRSNVAVLRCDVVCTDEGMRVVVSDSVVHQVASFS